VRHARSGKVHDDSGWQIEAEGISAHDVSPFVEALMDLTWAHRDYFRSLRSLCSIQLSIVIRCKGEPPTFYLSADVLARLAELGAAVDIDLYC
jgi:hypothetical protein